MKTGARLLITICSLLLASGCATTQLPPMPSATDLFSDSTFRRPSGKVSSADLFTLSAPMQAYLTSPQFHRHIRNSGPEHGLVDALYKKGELKLEYDATITRNAAETYEAGKGNCLSLVIMTAAFAKELGMRVNYQNVMMDEQWSRSGSIYIASTHVNLTLAKRKEYLRAYEATERILTIDFLPPEEAARYRTHSLDEETIEAMYLNNRAAEEMARDRLDDAYWWARAAIEKNPGYITAYNTLGVVYQRHGDFQLAERVYRRALERSPEDKIVMHNLVPVLARLGKADESKELAARLASIDPTPPFHYFQLGMKAMEDARYEEARGLFAREVKRSPYYHEFHFWLAIAHWRLGEAVAARKEMTLAVDTSTSADATGRYSSKLAYLRSVTTPARRTY